MSENQALGDKVNFAEYQKEAWRFDQHPGEPDKGLVIALLGLGGEVGTLQTTQKKAVRDSDGHSDKHANVMEDLGDILWYVADAATWLGSDLDQIAAANLKKIEGRWHPHDHPFPSTVERQSSLTERIDKRLLELPAAHLFDGRARENERLPRQMTIYLAEMPGSPEKVLPILNGVPSGNLLGDNSYDSDGYRWHDCFHFANAAVLGWSPVLRSLLKRKRKSSPTADDVEDGGRAIAIEEGISAMIFEAASRAGGYESVRVVDSEVLGICARMTRGLEVHACSPLEWEQAILRGCDTWRIVNSNGQGAVECDLDARTIQARSMSKAERRSHADVAIAYALELEKAKKKALRKGK
jgi:NTP pyrophosphatase (non-canonical NTP hydrolase)